jgi:hypothetical protein
MIITLVIKGRAEASGVDWTFPNEADSLHCISDVQGKNGRLLLLGL